MNQSGNATQQSTAPKPSQTTYKSGKFEVASWEVMGEIAEKHVFEPINLEVLSAEESITDPMFADYGKGQDSSAIKRWRSSIKEIPMEAEVKPRISLEEHDAKVKQASDQARQAALQEAKGIRDTEINKMRDSLVATIQDVQKKVDQQFLGLEKEAVKLAVEIARKIIDQAVEINPEYIVPIVRQALGLAGSATVKKVKISAQDMEFIEVMGVASKLKEYDGSWQFEIDAGIKSGCMIETSAGEIDFRLDRAFNELASQIVKVVQ